MYRYLKTKTALYIEDDVDVLKNITTLLQNYFKDVYSSSNAENGYGIFLKNSVDLLLVDIELPGMSGIEFIKKIREVDKEIPIVIISAYTKTDYLLESVELKIDKYIVKPLTSKKLHEFLEKMDLEFKDKNILQLIAGVSINLSEATVMFDNEKHQVTAKELCFLKILVKKRFISYDEISEIWEDNIPTQDAIRSFLKILRKKLPTDTLKNRQNMGYYV
jgi:DNA-binding response OmpR family regulator